MTNHNLLICYRNYKKNIGVVMIELTFCINCIHCREESTLSKTFKEYYCLKHSKTQINYVTGKVELLPEKRIRCEAINTEGNCPEWTLDESNFYIKEISTEKE